MALVCVRPAHSAPKGPGSVTLVAPYANAWGWTLCSDQTGTAACTIESSGNVTGAVQASAEVATGNPGVGTAIAHASGVVEAYYDLTRPAPSVNIAVSYRVARAEAVDAEPGLTSEADVALVATAQHGGCADCVGQTSQYIADAPCCAPPSVEDADVTITFDVRRGSGDAVPAGTIVIRSRINAYADIDIHGSGYVSASGTATVTKVVVTPGQ
jgi:hypothetical protein